MQDTVEAIVGVIVEGMELMGVMGSTEAMEDMLIITLRKKMCLSFSDTMTLGSFGGTSSSYSWLVSFASCCQWK